MGRMKQLMLELQEQNPNDEDYEYQYNEWLKQFESTTKIKVKKFKLNQPKNGKEKVN